MRLLSKKVIIGVRHQPNKGTIKAEGKSYLACEQERKQRQKPGWWRGSKTSSLYCVCVEKYACGLQWILLCSNRGWLLSTDEISRWSSELSINTVHSPTHKTTHNPSIFMMLRHAVSAGKKTQRARRSDEDHNADRSLTQESQNCTREKDTRGRP